MADEPSLFLADFMRFVLFNKCNNREEEMQHQLSIQLFAPICNRCVVEKTINAPN